MLQIMKNDFYGNIGHKIKWKTFLYWAFLCFFLLMFTILLFTPFLENIIKGILNEEEKFFKKIVQNYETFCKRLR